MLEMKCCRLVGVGVRSFDGVKFCQWVKLCD